jgi:hypothetical protein
MGAAVLLRWLPVGSHPTTAAAVPIAVAHMVVSEAGMTHHHPGRSGHHDPPPELSPRRPITDGRTSNALSAT